jgi:hypothetical protein
LYKITNFPKRTATISINNNNNRSSPSTPPSSPRNQCSRCGSIILSNHHHVVGVGSGSNTMIEDEFVDIVGSNTSSTYSDKMGVVGAGSGVGVGDAGGLSDSTNNKTMIALLPCCESCEKTWKGKIEHLGRKSSSTLLYHGDHDVVGGGGISSSSNIIQQQQQQQLNNLQTILLELRNQDLQLQQQEQDFEIEQCSFTSFSKQVRESLEAQKVRVKGLKAELNLLDREVVPAIAFKTGYVETDNVRYGTINGLRLGGPHYFIPNPSTTSRGIAAAVLSGPSWEEVSCAWGEIALFIARAGKVLRHEFNDFEIFPLGGKSTLVMKNSSNLFPTSISTTRATTTVLNLFYSPPIATPSTTTQWFSSLNSSQGGGGDNDVDTRLIEFNRAIMGLSVCLNELCMIATPSAATIGVDFNPIKQIFASVPTTTTPTNITSSSMGVSGSNNNNSLSSSNHSISNNNSKSNLTNSFRMTDNTTTTNTTNIMLSNSNNVTPTSSSVFIPNQPQILVDVLFKDLSICLKDLKGDATRWTAACGLLLINVTALMVWFSKRKGGIL